MSRHHQQLLKHLSLSSSSSSQHRPKTFDDLRTLIVRSIEEGEKKALDRLGSLCGGKFKDYLVERKRWGSDQIRDVVGVYLNAPSSLSTITKQLISPSRLIETEDVQYKKLSRDHFFPKVVKKLEKESNEEEEDDVSDDYDDQLDQEPQDDDVQLDSSIRFRFVLFFSPFVRAFSPSSCLTLLFSSHFAQW
jgi:hypothetical protein